MKSKTKLMLGDNIESLKKIPDNSIDSVVTDGPYGLSFMQKRWDYDVPSVDFWKEVYRVLKPGGHVLSFGGTRTYHRMVVNIEDAGFEIRDQIMWLYGSGFPKSHNIGKAIDATIKTGKSNPKSINKSEMSKTDGDVVEVLQPNNGILGDKKLVTKTIGASLETNEAKEHEGWGTALKPAVETICVARKPLSEKSVALNVLKWGTGGINIDGCRVGTEILKEHKSGNIPNDRGEWGLKEGYIMEEREGRFPANIIFECICDEVIKGEKGDVKSNTREAGNSFNNYDDKKGKVVTRIENYNDKGDTHTNPECTCRLLDEQSGVTKTKADLNYNHNKTESDSDVFKSRGTYTPREDKGGASRFFYNAKVSKKERNMGLDGFEDKKKDFETTTRTNKETADKFGCERKGVAKNTHPTVKPVSLMSYLCRLITPVGGTILDPYMGSGSTGIAALLEGFNFIGMDLDEDYVKIAEARIKNYESYREFLKK